MLIIVRQHDFIASNEKHGQITDEIFLILILITQIHIQASYCSYKSFHDRKCYELLILSSKFNAVYNEIALLRLAYVTNIQGTVLI